VLQNTNIKISGDISNNNYYNNGKHLLSVCVVGTNLSPLYSVFNKMGQLCCHNKESVTSSVT
jgi:hypothetical protein